MGVSPFGAKAIGVLLLALSIIVAFQGFGLALGVVTWIGQICIAGAVLVLLMSWHFHFALRLGMVALLASSALPLASVIAGTSFV